MGTERSWCPRAEYSKTNGDETVVLEVPQQAASRDYPRVLDTLFDDLARLEKRPSGTILRDVRSASVDIIRLAIEGGSTHDGRIPVEAGRRVYAAGRDLLLAAACSVLEPRSVFAKRKPEGAMGLLNRARFGQTEVGSFVLTIECPVPPCLHQALTDKDDSEEPIERKTVVLLAQALHGANSASRESAAANGGIQPFRERKQCGVSANLCDAVAEMFEATAADAISASFSFAARRPLQAPVPRLVRLSSDILDTLREAASSLRAEATYPALEVLGSVVKLSSQDSTSGGDIVLHVHMDGRLRAVSLALDPGTYETAINAHKYGLLVKCVGDMARRGCSWTMENPRDFTVIPE